MENRRFEIGMRPIEDATVVELESGHELSADEVEQTTVGRAIVGMASGVEKVGGMIIIFPTNRIKPRHLEDRPIPPAS